MNNKPTKLFFSLPKISLTDTRFPVTKDYTFLMKANRNTNLFNNTIYLPGLNLMV